MSKKTWYFRMSEDDLAREYVVTTKQFCLPRILYGVTTRCIVIMFFDQGEVLRMKRVIKASSRIRKCEC